MSDSLSLYDTLLLAVRKANPDEDPRRQRVFAWAVAGLLLEKSIHLTVWALVIASAAKDQPLAVTGELGDWYRVQISETGRGGASVL